MFWGREKSVLKLIVHIKFTLLTTGIFSLETHINICNFVKQVFFIPMPLHFFFFFFPHICFVFSCTGSFALETVFGNWVGKMIEKDDRTCFSATRGIFFR